MTNTRLLRTRTKRSRVIDQLLEFFQIILKLHAYMKHPNFFLTQVSEEAMQEKLLRVVKLGKDVTKKLPWIGDELPKFLYQPIIHFDLVPAAMPGPLSDQNFVQVCHFGFKVLSFFAKKDKRAVGMMQSLIKMAYPHFVPVLMRVTHINPLARKGLCEVTMIVNSFPKFEDIQKMQHHLTSSWARITSWDITTVPNQRAKIK